MKFDKNDPLYYKETMNKLINQAKDNGIKVELEDSHLGEFKYLTFSNLNCKVGVKLLLDEEL